MSSDHYRLHRFTLAVEADDAEVRAAFARRLAHFRTGAGDPPTVPFRIVSVASGAGNDLAASLPAVARPFYLLPRGEALYAEDRDTIHLAWDGVLRLRVDLARGEAAASVLSAAPERLTILPRLFLTIALVELLKRQGLFAVHAAGVARDGRAVLLAGTSGAGKSTLALALAQEGFALLGDDLVLLAPEVHGPPRLLAFPQPIDLDARALGWLTALPAGAPEAGRGPGGTGKHGLELAKLGVAIAESAWPSAVVFPRFTAGPQSSLHPLSADQALLELAPDVLLTEPRSSQAHLDALGALARSAPAYRLETARDFASIAALLAPLVEPGGRPA